MVQGFDAEIDEIIIQILRELRSSEVREHQWRMRSRILAPGVLLRREKTLSRVGRSQGVAPHWDRFFGPSPCGPA
jgi:hypothetical protein